MCAARLHNFCEDERRAVPSEDNAALDDEDGSVEVLHPPNEIPDVPGNSMMRDYIILVYHAPVVIDVTIIEFNIRNLILNY